MLSCARIVLSILNVIILISALSHILMANYLNQQPSQGPCLRDNASSLLWTGIFILITTIIGILGSCCKVKALESIYLWVLLISTAATIIFSTFISAMMPPQSALATYGKTSTNGFWLKEYKPALQKALVNEKDWYEVKSCYIETRICDVMRNQSSDQKVLLVEIGCCFPPNRCGLVQNMTSRWVAPDTGLLSEDKECKMWLRVGQDCFDCDSCKAGYLANYQDQWDNNIGTQVGRIFLLIATVALAFYAFRYENDDAYDPKHGKFVHHI
ncbi:hypothetical protein Pfo_008805 [Paulownia fortunei]|nr:hypothetical protein Pfo_008805 [Paulownia fortunei]